MELDCLDGLGHRRFLAQDYAVIDPRQVEAETDWWAGLGAKPLAPRALADDSAILPQLLPLRQLPETQRIELLERSDAWGCEHEQPLFSALLQCEAEPQRVLAHLTHQLLLPVPEGGMGWVLFYDPRVFQHLCWQWSAEQIKTLLGPIAAWTYFSAGSWRTCVPDDIRAPTRLHLSDRQWQQLDRMEHLNRSLKRLRREAASTLDDDLPLKLDQALAHAISTEQLGHPDDIRLCAEHRVRYGPQLHLHPQMAHRLQNARTGERAYTRGCAGLDDAEYRRLAADATQREGTHHE